MSNPEPQLPVPTPPELNYPGTVFVDRDAEHIKILSICWYVASGLAALFGCIPLGYVIAGLVLAFVPNAGGGGGGGPPPAFVGWIIAGVGILFALVIWTGAVLSFLTAQSLPQRRRLVVCYVAAALACLQMPVGTLLGVFTLIVLSRPNVRASFG